MEPKPRSLASEKKRSATQKDVAQLAGVSLSTVSYVLNDGPRPVSEETRRRVLTAIEALQYRPNRHAQQLSSEKWDNRSRKRFGVILCGGVGMLTRPFYGAVLAGIYQEAYRQDLRVQFAQFLEDIRDPILFNELIQGEEIFGLILVSLNISLSYWNSYPDLPDLLERMRQRVANVVCVERKWAKWPAVTFDRCA